MRENLYSAADEKWLIDNYRRVGPIAAAAEINRSYIAVRSKASKLGLKYDPAPLLCAVPGCDKICSAKGLCLTHYKHAFVSAGAKGAICNEEGCSKPAKYNNGMCHSCYSNRWAKEHNDELYARNKEKIKAYQKSLYVSHREDILARNRRCRAENADRFRYLEKKKLLLYSDKAYAIYGNGCELCHSRILPVLEWHHRKARGESRVEGTKNIIKSVARTGLRNKDIMLLCGNCHVYMNLQDKTNRHGYLATMLWLFGGSTWREKRVEKVLNMYSFKCSCCGGEDPMYLSWHHRLGDNYKKREGQDSLLSRVIANAVPVPDVLLLCRNCHIFYDMIDKTNTKGMNQLRVLRYRKTGKIKINVDASVWAARYVQRKYGAC